jgi:hypothetical protein
MGAVTDNEAACIHSVPLKLIDFAKKVRWVDSDTVADNTGHLGIENA